MENYFSKYSKNIIGQDQVISTPYHERIRIMYADWTASGRCFGPIEDRIRKEFLPFVANTHTDTNDTGTYMTYAYHQAKQIIKKHVNASEKDVLISSNSGMTGVVNKFQRILGLKVHQAFKHEVVRSEEDRPIVFVSHMEHHSNQTSWLETIADVEIVSPNEEGLFCLLNFERLLNQYKNRKTKIAAITSCSNVTGIMTPYFDVAEMMHRVKGYCFVDFACSAPYVKIDMHPDDAKGRYLDAIYFSPHKFLGGPGTTGILVFNEKLYVNEIPDNPGGGTVDWTNPWGKHKYIDNIEEREDGGTPAFLQTIKAAMCMQLKDEMGVEQIQAREEEILEQIWPELEKIPNLHVLAAQHKKRLGVISFYIDDLHFNLGVKLLNDKFGIQTRGGCSCAGTYGHYLLNLTPEVSDDIMSQIDQGNCSRRPGWIRMSIHPTHTDEEIRYLVAAVKQLAEKHGDWIKDYELDLMHGKIKRKQDEVGEALKRKVEEQFNTDFC